MSEVSGLERVARLLGAEAVGAVQRLDGGADGVVQDVQLLTREEARRVVVKQFPDDAASARHEWHALRFCRHVAITCPDPILLDINGRWLGTPTIVMSRLTGRPLLTPVDVDGWTGRLAVALARIHRTASSDVPATMLRPGIWQRWHPEPLSDTSRTSAITAAVSVLRGRTWQRGVCHGDFHPANVLFEDDRLTGVVDWISARHAPVLSDVGRCRAALAVWPGGDAPELFRSHYAEESHRPLDGLAYWDLLAGEITLQNAAAYLPIYTENGIDMDVGHLMARAAWFSNQALEEIQRAPSPR